MKIKQLLIDAYEAGYSGSLELAQSYADEIIDKFQQENNWIIYKVATLRSLPVGTTFHHRTRGKCWITNNGYENEMKFQDGTTSKFYADDVPWTVPMRIINV